MRKLVVCLTLLMLLAGCRGDDSASEAVEKLVEDLSDSDYAAAYDMLHPVHQAIVSEELFVDCGEQAEQSGNPAVDEIEIAGESQDSAIAVLH